MEEDKIIFKVSAKSNVHSLSTAITKTYLEGKQFEIHSIGEMSNNQAVKSIARACEQLSGKGKNMCIKIFFGDIPHKEREGNATVICFRLVEVE